MDCWGVVGSPVRFWWRVWERRYEKVLLLDSALAFPDIDPEVMVMSVLLHAGLLRFERGFDWFFFSAVGGGQAREVRGSRQGKAFSVL